MKFPVSKRALRLIASLIMLLFVGDIIADAASDLVRGPCSTQTSQSSPDHGKAPCPQCACAIHMGAVVIADLEFRFNRPFQPALALRIRDEAAPPRLAASIDLPPQLA
jgi:hypothetical protein